MRALCLPHLAKEALEMEWEARSEVDFRNADIAPAGEGYAIARSFTVSASRSQVEADVLVEVVGGKAITREVTIRTPDARGVTSNTLRSIPIRDFVAQGVRNQLLRVGPRTESGAVVMVLAWMEGFTEADAAAVKALVGYVDVEVGHKTMTVTPEQPPARIEEDEA
jgi:hypothetical protein